MWSFIREVTYVWISYHQLTPGCLQKPSYTTLAQWVRDLWEEVDHHLITKPFKCCGVLVKMDGTEDDMVFDYELLTDSQPHYQDASSLCLFFFLENYVAYW